MPSNHINTGSEKQSDEGVTLFATGYRPRYTRFHRKSSDHEDSPASPFVGVIPSLQEPKITKFGTSITATPPQVLVPEFRGSHLSNSY